MKRFSQVLVVAVAVLCVSGPAQAVGKAKATPTPWPSEMPNFASDRVKFGYMFLKKKDYRQAEMEFRSATLIEPQNFEAAVGLADAMYMRHNYPESLKEYQRALRLVRPSYAQAPYMEAAKLAGQGKIAEALIDYRRVAHIKPQAGEMLNKGVAALQAGDKAGAKKAFEEAAKLDADYADAYYKLAAMSYEAKDYLGAIDLLEKAAAADPTDGLIFFKLGNAYYHFQTVTPKGDKFNFYREWDRKSRDNKWHNWCLNKAVEAYRKADRLKPNDFDILFNLGSTELNLNHAALAVRALEKAVRLDNDDSDAHTVLGNAYFALAKDLPGYNKAIHHYRVVLRLDPKRYEMEYNLGQAYYAKAKIRPESDQFEITPANSQFYYAKGAEYHKTDMLQQAMEHFNKFLDYAPKEAPKRKEAEKLVVDIGKETARSVQGGGHH